MMPDPASNSVPARVGFIGFGEVAGVFSGALGRDGVEVLAYDVLSEQPDGMARLKRRAGAERVKFVTLSELIAQCDWILSTVTTGVAEAVARAATPLLRPGKKYVDLNATSPSVKQAVANIVAPTGAHFVEGAILTAVGVTGARTRILIGDDEGPAAAEALARLGLNTSFYGTAIGQASAFKLLRSVFSKGMEALLIEFLVAGRRAGLQEDLWSEVVELFAQNGFERVAENWVRTHGTACERRHHEVVQVAEEMRSLGLDPIMTEATEKVFRRSVDARLKEKFADKPATFESVISALEISTRANSSRSEDDFAG
jgi:3-hydroxyisobutyrate dehydrogenase-like beta-hydroxyacid dehydrogenase